MHLFVKDLAFYKKILTIGGPVALQQVITVGVNMMDTVMLGQLDETVLSAGAAATQIHSLFQFMSMGMGMGDSVLIARYWGAEEIPSLRKTLSLMYRCCLLISLAFTAMVGLAPAPVLRLLTPYSEVIAGGGPLSELGSSLLFPLWDVHHHNYCTAKPETDAYSSFRVNRGVFYQYL